MVPWALPKSIIQRASRSVQPFLQGSRLWQTDRQTERQTDHPTLYVTIGRMYVRILRCSLKVEACLTCTQRISQPIHESNKVDKYPTSTPVIQMQRSNDIVTHWRILQKRIKDWRAYCWTVSCVLLTRAFFSSTLYSYLEPHCNTCINFL